MPLPEDDAREVLDDLMKVREREMRRLDRIRGYMIGETCQVYSPRKSTREYRQLVNMSKVNVMPLVVSTFAENLFVEGYRPARSSKNAKAWGLWQDNRMDQRQSLIYRSALTYGVSYATVLKAAGDTGKALIDPYSPRHLTAVYEDPTCDEWPVYAICVSSGYDAATRKDVTRVRLYDDEFVYYFVRPNDKTGTMTYVQEESGEHGLGVTPVVRFVNAGVDLDNGPASEVEALIELQDQLDNTTYGLLISQQFTAFRQRWVTGMTIEQDASGVDREPFNAGVDRVFQGESPDTKFGEFGESNLDGYLASRQSTLRIISAKAQLAPHALLVSDGVSNLSAEALAALEAAQQRKTGEQKTSFGESNEQMLRLASKAAGDEAGWEDTKAQVVWRDTESRSLAQVADALGKMAQMLAIPPRALWDKIPGVTDTDVQRWEKLADAEDGLGVTGTNGQVPGQPAPPSPEKMMQGGNAGNGNAGNGSAPAPAGR